MSTERAAPSRLSRVADVVTVLAVVAAVGLLIENRMDRRAAQQQAEAQWREVVSSVPPAGSLLRPVGVSDSTGGRHAIFGEAELGRRLVYLFKTDCPVCGEQKDEWVELAAMARARGWAVTALTSESLAPWVRSYFASEDVEVLRLDNPVEAAERLGVRVVPATILVGEEGRVLSFHVGRLSSVSADSVRRLLSMPAPDAVGTGE